VRHRQQPHQVPRGQRLRGLHVAADAQHHLLRAGAVCGSSSSRLQQTCSSRSHRNCV
jgi:hypothetical protein